MPFDLAFELFSVLGKLFCWSDFVEHIPQLSAILIKSGNEMLPFLMALCKHC